jgi:hypothetical protein
MNFNRVTLLVHNIWKFVEQLTQYKLSSEIKLKIWSNKQQNAALANQSSILSFRTIEKLLLMWRKKKGQ